VASFLERVGFQRQQVESIVEPLVLGEEEVEVLAEMEHGRWVVERLQQNWCYDGVRNTEKKLHPDLVGWDKLPDSVKKWDRNAVRNWPKLLAEAGTRIEAHQSATPSYCKRRKKAFVTAKVPELENAIVLSADEPKIAAPGAGT
jgi:hypothetical protein